MDLDSVRLRENGRAVDLQTSVIAAIAESDWDSLMILDPGGL